MLSVALEIASLTVTRWAEKVINKDLRRLEIGFLNPTFDMGNVGIGTGWYFKMKELYIEGIWCMDRRNFYRDLGSH